MKVGEMLRELRLRRNVNQSQLAEKVGLTTQRISALEQSDDCQFLTFQKIANALDFEVFAIAKEDMKKESVDFN